MAIPAPHYLLENVREYQNNICELLGDLSVSTNSDAFKIESLSMT